MPDSLIINIKRNLLQSWTKRFSKNFHPVGRPLAPEELHGEVECWEGCRHEDRHVCASYTWVEEEIGHDEGEDVRGGVGQHSALVRSWGKKLTGCLDQGFYVAHIIYCSCWLSLLWSWLVIWIVVHFVRAGSRGRPRGQDCRSSSPGWTPVEPAAHYWSIISIITAMVIVIMKTLGKRPDWNDPG